MTFSARATVPCPRIMPKAIASGPIISRTDRSAKLITPRSDQYFKYFDLMREDLRFSAEISAKFLYGMGPYRRQAQGQSRSFKRDQPSAWD